MLEFPVDFGNESITSFLLNRTLVYQEGADSDCYECISHRRKSGLNVPDECFIPGMILYLETTPLLFKIYMLLTLGFVLLVVVDKKIMFHNVLFMEHNLRLGKYSR